MTAGHSDNTTAIVAGSALGVIFPLYVIYKGQRLTEKKTKACLAQTKFITTNNGRSTRETFYCFLLYDGHSTHITEAPEKDIHMFVLPQHSSH